MTNLYNYTDKINKFCNKNRLSKLQLQFLLDIINGNPKRASLNNIVRLQNKGQLAELQTSIDQMIRETPFMSWKKPYFNHGYIKLLKNTSSAIKAMQKAGNTLAELIEKKPKHYTNFLKTIDSLYSITKNKYQGTILLPISQRFDARLGDSRGECFGYITEWAIQILLQKNPFGVLADGMPAFKPVTLDTSKYPDLNHLAVLTSRISKCQRLQTNRHKLNINLSSMPAAKNQQIKYEHFITYEPYQPVSQIVEKLVTQADNDSKKIYHLSLRNDVRGHALGFCKVNNKYHFLDSNFGWIRFEKAIDFKQWLPIYFKSIGYDKYFKYAINTFSLYPHTIKSKPQCKTLEINFFLTFLLGCSINYCIRYFVFYLKNIFFSPKEELLLGPVDLTLPKSIEFLDLAVKSSEAIKQNSAQKSSLVKIAIMLDIPFKELAEVRRRAENNKEFRKTNSTINSLDLAVNLRKSGKSNSTQQGCRREIIGMLDLSFEDLAKVQKRAENNEEFKKRIKTSPLFKETTDKLPRYPSLYIPV